MAHYAVNELLCFVSVQNDKLDRANLETVLLDFYLQDEMLLAKRLLISEREKDALKDEINEFSKPRRGQNVQPKLVSDVLNIWAVVDRVRGGELPTQFVAANLNRLPTVSGEKYNLQFLVLSILKLQHQSTADKRA